MVTVERKLLRETVTLIEELVALGDYDAKKYDARMMQVLRGLERYVLCTHKRG